MHRPLTLLFGLVLTLGAISLGASKPVKVPLGVTPQIDGIIGEEEWGDAARFRLVGGGELLIKCDPAALYIAIRGTSEGWSHVYTGDTSLVRVLHASAALGDAAYRKQGETWIPISQFAWEMHNFTERTLEEKARYFDNHGWIANSVDRGRTREYKLSRAMLAHKKLAVVYASDPSAPHHWPETLRDATLDPELVRGNVPAAVSFDPAQWAEPYLSDTLRKDLRAAVEVYP